MIDALTGLNELKATDFVESKTFPGRELNKLPNGNNFSVDGKTGQPIPGGSPNDGPSEAAYRPNGKAVFDTGVNEFNSGVWTFAVWENK